MSSRIALLFSVLFSLLLGCSCLVAIDAFRALNQTLVLGEQNAEGSHGFAVEEGDSLAAIAKRLQDQGLLAQKRDRRYLTWLGRLSGHAGNIQVGEYDLAKHNSAWALLQAMVDGDVTQYSFTIIEGWNIYQVLDALARNETLIQSKPALTPANVATQLNIDAVTAEGWLLPDTYLFPKGVTDISVLERAHDAMKKVLDKAWGNKAGDLPYSNAYEVLTMASIIEKETAAPEEREQIAGVFVRRLKIGMLLQTDPTVIYGIGPSFDGNIRKKDLLTDTPYNTYRRAGLPPTPIAMPGQASIEAALNPADGDSLYFVSRGDGTHVFSATLKAHNEAVNEYQRKRKSQPAKQTKTQ